VGELKRALRRLVGAADDCRVLLANRSAQLMRLAARALFRRCRNVLATDLTWPGYMKILRFEGRLAGSQIRQVPIRRAVLVDQRPAAQIVKCLADAYITHNCDGLFLPAVSHDGIRLPLREVYGTITQTRSPKFVAVDGAQAFCQIPTRSDLPYCDLYLTGCHKWLGAHLPMGVAFSPRLRSQEFIRQTKRAMIRSFELDDPLLAFTDAVERDAQTGFSETVNLISLFSCRAAVADCLDRHDPVSDLLRRRRLNADNVCELTAGTSWAPFVTRDSFRSAILLLRARSHLLRTISPADTRAFFASRGLALTTYAGGLIRLSMPEQPVCSSQLGYLGSILRCTTTIREYGTPIATVAPRDPALSSTASVH